MEQPQRKQIRLSGYDYSQKGAYFVTVCTRERRKILSEISVVNNQTQEPCLTLLWYGMIADQCIKELDSYYDYLSVDRYVVMPDHIHFLIRISESGKNNSRSSVIARFVGTFKRFCNRKYGDNIWQARYYDHVIRNQTDYDEIWEYIENNPRKWIITKSMQKP